MSQYAWNQYRCYMGGRFVTGITKFSYKSSREKKLIYAEGDKPQDVGRGNRSYECSMSVLQSELEAIIISAGGDPLDITDMTIVHTYAAKYGLPLVTDVIEGVEFTDIEKAMEQGAVNMDCPLPCICTNVKYNVTNPFN